MNSILRMTRLTVILIMVLCVSQLAKADIVVSIGNSTIAPNGSGLVDVWISSTTGTDKLGAYGFDFQINSVTGTSALKFLDPQTSPERSNPNFVFNSGDVGVIGQVSSLADNYAAANISNDPNGITIGTTPTTQLLAQLQLFSTTGTGAPQAGDQFSISLNPSLNTFFFDENSSPLNFSSASGIVTIGFTAVPEPTGLIPMSIAGLVIGYRRWRKNQKPKA